MNATRQLNRRNLVQIQQISTEQSISARLILASHAQVLNKKHISNKIK